MLAFQQRELDLLVATTVIEVGVDVPNASLMIVKSGTAGIGPAASTARQGWPGAVESRVY